MLIKKMDLTVLKKLLEDLDGIKKTLNDFIENNQDKYEWTSEEFKTVLKSIGKKACGNDSTANFHINKVNKFIDWNGWAKEVALTNVEYYAQRLRMIHASHKHLKDISDKDIEWIQEQIETLKKERRNKDFKITENNKITTNENCEKIIEDRLKGILEGSIKPNKFDLFGILLPPRRAEVSNIKCLKNTNEINKEDDGKMNYYIKSTRTFIFDKYKTKGKYGTQFFSLNELDETLPFVDPKVKDIVIKLIDKELYENGKNLIRQDYRDGKEYSGFSSLYSITNKFSINDARKYWSSKVFKTGNIEWYKKLNCWLSHSANVDVNHYQKV